MTDQHNRRKALYRRLFEYGKTSNSRVKMLSYLFNRLKNDQLADVLSLLDNDPECRPPARGARECNSGRSCTDPRCKVHGNWYEK